MPYAVDILDSAKEELIEDTLYVMEKWGRDKARESHAAITKKLDLLATQPYLGVVVPELAALGKTNYRVYSHEHHTRFLYDVDEDKRKITVHMVFSSTQDFQSLLYRRIIRTM
jgi:plasmid stabilization system protein ParE